jgi:glycosyltransferase involved in cell wall biosynthesis
VRELTKRLARWGLEVEVLTTDPSGNLASEEKIDGVLVRRFRSWAPGDAYFFSGELRRFLKTGSRDYDLVHAHTYHALPALYASGAKRDGNHFVFTPHYHGTGHTRVRQLLHVPYRLIARRIFSEADGIICVSNYEKELIFSKFKIDPNKIYIIPNGVNLREFEQHSKKLSTNTNFILYVGRLEGYKRIDVAIRSLEFLDENVKLRIVGRGSRKNALVQLTKNLNMEKRVTFFENLPRHDLLELYASSNAYILLSMYEAYGIGVAEALASGTPCVVSNNSALAEWVDGRNCIGVDEPGDPKSVAEAIQHALKIGRVNGEQLHDWDEVAAAVLRVYTSLESQAG